MDNQSLRNILYKVIDSHTAATAHYQIWFTLRNRALPDYFKTMNNQDYLDFFDASNSGSFKLMFIEIGNLFDSDLRSSSISNLKKSLIEYGFLRFKDNIENNLKLHSKLVHNIISIRNKLMAHKDIDADSDALFEKHGIIPDEIKKLLFDLGLALQKIEHHINNDSSFTRVCLNNRFGDATINLLKTLKKGSVS